MLSAESNENKCGICKEDSSCDFVTRCGHYFHEHCLYKWFDRQKNYCPYCEQIISESKNTERIRWNLKRLKVDEKQAASALEFFETYIKMPLLKSYVPAYEIETIITLISAGWDINDKEEGARRLLQKACQYDDIYRLNCLLELGLKLEPSSVLYNNALVEAENRDSIIVKKRLQSFNLHSSKSSVDGSTKLHKACSDNKFFSVKSLIESGASVNARNIRGVRPLHLACALADIKVIDLLIEKGAEINCVDFNGKSPLYEAVTSELNRKDVISKFLELKAKINYLDQDRNNLLHVALINRKFDDAELLIDHFEDINALNCFGESALHLAVDIGPKSLIEKLLARGADAKLKDPEGNTVLHRAVEFNSIEVVRALLKDGKSDINALNANNEIALFTALKRTLPSEYIKELSKYGFDLNFKNKDGKTLLDVALERSF